jgi:hypothetical protein
MNETLRRATRKILTAEGDGKLILADNNPDFMLVHSLVNYARAKQQASGIMKILEGMRREAKSPDLKTSFQQFLKEYLPSIEPAEGDLLFEAIVRDNE